MIQFSNETYFLKGTGSVTCRNIRTWDIQYHSDKFQTGSLSTSVVMGEIRAGIGNAISAIIPSDASVNIKFDAADFSHWLKAAEAGAQLQSAAPDMVCAVGEAQNGVLYVPTTKGTPVSPIGFAKPIVYVQEIGKAATIEKRKKLIGLFPDNALVPDDELFPNEYYEAVDNGSKAYQIDGTTYAIIGFEPEDGVAYKIWYFVNNSAAQISGFNTLMHPGIVHCTMSFPVYKHDRFHHADARDGTLFAIVPRLQFDVASGIEAGQTEIDITSVSGMAVPLYEAPIKAGCDDESYPLAFYIYVPCDGAESNIKALIANGNGIVSMTKNSFYWLKPQLLMKDNRLAPLDNVFCRYTLSSGYTLPNGTTISELTGAIISGNSSGDFEIDVTYTTENSAYSDSVYVSVR